MIRVVIFAVAFSSIFLTHADSLANDEENDLGGKGDSVKLTVFYESYCPYSIHFVVDQLVPTWEQFKDHVQLDLLPFGNAKQWFEDGHYKFECQHGPKECVGNTLHACAIHAACGEHGTLKCHGRGKNLSKAVDYIGCVIGQTDQRNESDRCAGEAGLEAATINKCAIGRLGERLESAYGNRTKAFKPSVHYVPFIAINDKHTEEEQKVAEDDLKRVICKYIPDQCP